LIFNQQSKINSQQFPSSSVRHSCPDHLSADNLCLPAGFNNSGVDRLGFGHLGLTIWMGRSGIIGQS
jgi:hypothetical protein